MRGGSQGSVLRSIQTLFETGSATGMNDRELLEQFRARRDEGADAAFAALMARHGPLVWSVCLGISRDVHAAEDAFQATFLILVRKAGSIRRCETLGPWLHGVARRVAVRAKNAVRRRQRQEERGRGNEGHFQTGRRRDSRSSERFIKRSVVCRRSTARSWCCAILKDARTTRRRAASSVRRARSVFVCLERESYCAADCAAGPGVFDSSWRCSASSPRPVRSPFPWGWLRGRSWPRRGRRRAEHSRLDRCRPQSLNWWKEFHE